MADKFRLMVMINLETGEVESSRVVCNGTLSEGEGAVTCSHSFDLNFDESKLAAQPKLNAVRGQVPNVMPQQFDLPPGIAELLKPFVDQIKERLFSRIRKWWGKSKATALVAQMDLGNFGK